MELESGQILLGYFFLQKEEERNRVIMGNIAWRLISFACVGSYFVAIV